MIINQFIYSHFVNYYFYRHIEGIFHTIMRGSVGGKY